MEKSGLSGSNINLVTKKNNRYVHIKHLCKILTTICQSSSHHWPQYNFPPHCPFHKLSWYHVKSFSRSTKHKHNFLYFSHCFCDQCISNITCIVSLLCILFNFTNFCIFFCSILSIFIACSGVSHSSIICNSSHLFLCKLALPYWFFTFWSFCCHFTLFDTIPMHYLF